MLEENYSEIPSEPKGKKWIFGLMVVVILLLIGGLVFWWMQKKNSNISNENTVSNDLPVEIQSEIPVTDPYPNDRDRDGIDDSEEEALGTSNQEFDTDSDGLSDLDEIEVWKTDPTKADTDGDGFNDGYEVLNGYNPLGEGTL